MEHTEVRAEEYSPVHLLTDTWIVLAFGLSLLVGYVEAEGEYFLGLYLHKGKDHGSLTGSDLLLGLAQLGSQHLPLLLQQGSCTTA